MFNYNKKLSEFVFPKADIDWFMQHWIAIYGGLFSYFFVFGQISRNKLPNKSKNADFRVLGCGAALKGPYSINFWGGVCGEGALGADYSF